MKNTPAHYPMSTSIESNSTIYKLNKYIFVISDEFSSPEVLRQQCQSNSFHSRKSLSICARRSSVSLDCVLDGQISLGLAHVLRSLIGVVTGFQ